MRTRKLVFQFLALLVCSASGTTGAAAAPPERQASMDGALRSSNESCGEESMAELRSVIEELERLGDAESVQKRLKIAYLALGLVQLSMHDEASAQESLERADLDPAYPLDRVQAWSPEFLCSFAEWLVTEGTAVTVAPRGESRGRSKPTESAGTPELSVGSRVRAELSGGGPPIIGSLAAFTDRTLVLVTDGHSKIELRRNGIQKLQMSDGRKGHALTGLLMGAATGALIGEIAPLDESCVGPDCYSRGENIGYGALGALVGALLRTDRWLDVPSISIRARLSGGRESVGVGVVLSF